MQTTNIDYSATDATNCLLIANMLKHKRVQAFMLLPRQGRFEWMTPAVIRKAQHDLSFQLNQMFSRSDRTGRDSATNLETLDQADLNRFAGYLEAFANGILESHRDIRIVKRETAFSVPKDSAPLQACLNTMKGMKRLPGKESDQLNAFYINNSIHSLKTYILFLELFDQPCEYPAYEAVLSNLTESYVLEGYQHDLVWDLVGMREKGDSIGVWIRTDHCTTHLATKSYPDHGVRSFANEGFVYIDWKDSVKAISAKLADVQRCLVLKAS